MSERLTCSTCGAPAVHEVTLVEGGRTVAKHFCARHVPPRLLLATGNRHKVGEIAAILREQLSCTEIELHCAADYPDIPEPEETGETFCENALLKARAYSDATGLVTLADDSGLIVDALDGRPGIQSARYAETPQARIERVLRELEAVPASHRNARFVCCMALVDRSGNELVREGTVEGRVLDRARGEGGFGYDPIFVPLEAPERTFAELSPAEKDAMSHRGRALKAIIPLISLALAPH